ncbi:MAG: hypothetical protein RL026_2611 [Pseudomonadota bacterium]|jgi:biopolymer transport protein ExbB
MENQVDQAVESAAQAGNAFSLEVLITHGDAFSYVLLGVLLLMSLSTWYIVFTKYLDQRSLIKSAVLASKHFWTAPTPREGAEKLAKGDEFRMLAEANLRAAAHHEGRLNDRISLADWLSMSVAREIDAVNSRLGAGLSWLATVGSSSPFIGLAGTVWGIVKALLKIGQTGQPSIGDIAGPIGEALIMTLIGLIVAVPAVIAYNLLLKRNKVVQEAIRDFNSEIEAYLVGGTRPEVAAAKPAAAPAQKK